MLNEVIVTFEITSKQERIVVNISLKINVLDVTGNPVPADSLIDCR